MTTLYTPDYARRRLTGDETCTHCGQVPEQHHSDGQCYTVEELAARLGFWQRTGAWPGADQECTQEAAP